jgi:hypothetical protein
VVADKKISAVVSSTDLDRSREFYEQKVGLALSPETIPNHLLFQAGGDTTLLVTDVRPGTSPITRRCASGPLMSTLTSASSSAVASSST